MTTAIIDQPQLASYLINTRVYGYVVPATGQLQTTMTYEVQGDQGTLMMAVVIGPEGPAGADMFLLNLQTSAVEDPGDLPQNLGNTKADIGKTWMFDDIAANGDIIGSSAYVWYGTSYRRMMFGEPGPPGPVPVINPSVTLVDPTTQTSSVTIPTGTNPYTPAMNFSLAAPAGPQGPAMAMATCPDVDLVTNPPQAGDVLGTTGRKTPDGNYTIWEPVNINQLLPSPFSMPESSFSSFSGISARAAIGSFAIAQQPWPWTPVVWGHIGAFGVELSANPLLIGCEVRLGDPTTGQLIGRGFGNSLGEVNIMPHYSDPNQPGSAITPANTMGVVPANHSNPAEGTIYVSLYNDGEIGLYMFHPTDAQLFIMLVPVTT
jgi:hypothetical protein